MLTIGRLCVKTAGRDAGKKCVVVSVLDNNHVLIDGETRRRKCNLLHLEPLNQVVDIKKDANHAEVIAVFKSVGVEVVPTKAKKAGVRPRTLRRSKLAKTAGEKPVPVKKEEPKKEEVVTGETPTKKPRKKSEEKKPPTEVQKVL